MISFWIWEERKSLQPAPGAEVEVLPVGLLASRTIDMEVDVGVATAWVACARWEIVMNDGSLLKLTRCVLILTHVTEDSPLAVLTFSLSVSQPWSHSSKRLSLSR